VAQALTTDIYNGYAVQVSGSAGSLQYFRLFNPASAARLHFTLRGGSGDADVYVKRHAEPTFTDNDCVSDAVGNTENRTYAGVEDEQYYYVLVYGYDAFSGATLHAYYSNPLTLATTRTIGSTQLSRQVYVVDVPAGTTRLQVTLTQTSGQSGHFNVYARQGDAPAVPNAVDCSTSSSSLPASCSIINPAAGKAYVMIEGSTSSNDYLANLRVDALKK
jgi:serine protease